VGDNDGISVGFREGWSLGLLLERPTVGDCVAMVGFAVGEVGTGLREGIVENGCKEGYVVNGLKDGWVEAGAWEGESEEGGRVGSLEGEFVTG